MLIYNMNNMDDININMTYNYFILIKIIISIIGHLCYLCYLCYLCDML